ncbi:pectate lyase [Bacillus sp. ISL-26]|uniref:pectate lyase family protein n=1 Tax=Bacillus sp. ISL-26 TaxID=2819119 RepID=UPI001BE8B2E1|nr:pectate lyase [Bacillus sp. ISL-26]MBT2634141.1 pectate lyase [Bacillus sp. ISL-26]
MIRKARQLVFGITLGLVLCLAISYSAPKQAKAAASYPDVMQGLTGFAGNAKDHNGKSKSAVSGGQGGSVVYVSNLNDLKNNAGGTDRKTIVITGDISSSGKVVVTVGANKTIVGSYTSHRLTNIYLTTGSNSNNVIFKNLIISHNAAIKGNNDIPMYIANGQNYWIDHVWFEGHSYNPNNHDDLGKLLYVGAKADFVTLSNSKFTDHLYGVILGYPNDDNEGRNYIGYPHMTITNNYFNNVYVRSPGLMRYGYFHAKNNYITNFNLGFTIHTNATVYSEANFFGNGNEKGGMIDDYGTAQFTDIGSFPALKAPKSPLTSWNPKTNYSYRTLSSQDAKNYAQSYAGAQNSTLRYP